MQQRRIRDTTGTTNFLTSIVSGEEVESNVVHLVSSEIHNSTLDDLTNSRCSNRSKTEKQTIHGCFTMFDSVSRNTCKRDRRTVVTVEYNSDGTQARLMRVILAGEDGFLDISDRSKMMCLIRLIRSMLTFLRTFAACLPW